jgi:hypothetical protein
METAVSPIPVETVKYLDGFEIKIPELGTAKLAQKDDEEEDLLIWLM